MSKVLAKQAQDKISRYFLKLGSHLTKPGSRCARGMATGVLKSGAVLANKIAAGICGTVSLSQAAKRLRGHCNKEGSFMKLPRGHMNSIKGQAQHGGYILFGGSGIQKRYAKMMGGLDCVKDGGKASIGLGYWLLDVVHFSKVQGMAPLFNKLCSPGHGAKSGNEEIMGAIGEVDAIIGKDVTEIFDRGMGRPICRGFTIAGEGNSILRLKETTKLIYNGTGTAVDKISRKMPLSMGLVATKMGKNKKHKAPFKCGAVRAKYKIKGKEHELWLVVAKRGDGGYWWLLARSRKENIIDVIKEAFTAYGFRWKIEEYHRHIKTWHNLEGIQVKIFEGLQGMLAILAIAMGIIYPSLSSPRIKLLLQSGIQRMNKEKLVELRNFIYYKTSAIIKTLLANMIPGAFPPHPKISQDGGQLRLALSYEL